VEFQVIACGETCVKFYGFCVRSQVCGVILLYLGRELCSFILLCVRRGVDFQGIVIRERAVDL